MLTLDSDFTNPEVMKLAASLDHAERLRRHLRDGAHVHRFG